jgi:hypothetical protein
VQPAFVRKPLRELRQRLTIFPEFKFSKCRPEVKDAFFSTVMPFEFRVRAIVVKKEKIYSLRLRQNKESFYAFFVKSMLKFDDGLLEQARIIIDGSGDKEFKRELGAYFRQQLGRGRVKEIRFSSSKSDPLVQLADNSQGRSNAPSPAVASKGWH